MNFPALSAAAYPLASSYRLQGCNCGPKPPALGDVAAPDTTTGWFIIGGLVLAATIGVFTFGMHASK